MAIETRTNLDEDFYGLLGPFLSRREVVRVVGDTIWDDDAKTWYVDLDAQRRVRGFVGVALHGRRLHVESLYSPKGDDARLLTRLVAAAVRAHSDHELHAVVRFSAAAAYTDNGFEAIGESKNFVKLRRTPRD